MLDQVYDAIVIGARIAGATVAALLGDAGYRVLLVERARFPSSTLSTHFFRGAGLLAVLSRLSILDRVLALDAPPLRHCYYYSEETEQPIIEPPQEPGALGYCLSVRREPLDALLLQRAAHSPSVDVGERTSATDLLWEGEQVVGASLMTMRAWTSRCPCSHRHRGRWASLLCCSCRRSPCGRGSLSLPRLILSVCAWLSWL